MEARSGLENSGLSFSNRQKVSWELFDGQAAIFERRAGLPDVHCRDIADAVLNVGEARPDDLIVEIGPGTGQVGRWFGAPYRYVGLDLSANMLEIFRRRSAVGPARRALIRCDANAKWPLARGAARVLFSSRAIHLLDHEHVASEVFRLARPEGAALVIGRVRRLPDSVRTRMADNMIGQLRRRGIEGHRGTRQNSKLVESCRRRGAELLEPLTVATWTVSTSPRQSLDSWRCLKSLAGIPLPEPLRHQVLDEVEAWAEGEFGGIDRYCESEETYTLKALRVPPAREV